MATQLIKVERSDGESKTVQLDLSTKLNAVREQLGEKRFMRKKDTFLWNGSSIDTDDEESTRLSELVGEDGKSPLKIGAVKPDLGEGKDGDLQRYDNLSAAQKLELFRRLEVYRGLTATTKEGFDKTAAPCVNPWHEDDLPASTRFRIPTKITSDHTFHEATRHLKTDSVDEASVSLSTPYGGGEAGFKHAQSHSEDSKTVKDYLIGKVLVRTVKVTVAPKNLQLTASFEKTVRDALLKDKSSKGIQAYNLVKALNEVGYYVPRIFTLGGALITEKTTDITEFSQADTESTEFHAEVNASFKGIGGGGKYSHSESREESSSDKHERNQLTFDQIGGRQGTFNDYPKFLDSLDSSINWDVIAYDELYPTVALISDKSMRRLCIQLLNNYATYEQIIDEQPLIDLIGYATQAEVAIEEQA
jgi:Fungal MACPF-like domain